MMASVLLVLLFMSLVDSQGLDFCNVRCDIDSQCGGTCNRCVTTTDNERICLGLSACGGLCSADKQCDALTLCNKCINGVCGGLPCHAECNSSAWCGADCPACMPNSIKSADNNRTVSLCSEPCGAPCNSSLNCVEPCTHCIDGVCGHDAPLSVGAVVGITIAAALVGGGLLFPLVVVMCFVCLIRENLDDDPSFAFIIIGTYAIPVGIALFALAFGLSLGLSPSVCCS
jgi:hypothetical protein